MSRYSCMQPTGTFSPQPQLSVSLQHLPLRRESDLGRLVATFAYVPNQHEALGCLPVSCTTSLAFRLVGLRLLAG